MRTKQVSNGGLVSAIAFLVFVFFAASD